MFLSAAQVHDLTEGTLLEFLEQRIPEGARLDYKRHFGDATKGKDEWKRELAKDASGFARRCSQPRLPSIVLGALLSKPPASFATLQPCRASCFKLCRSWRQSILGTL